MNDQEKLTDEIVKFILKKSEKHTFDPTRTIKDVLEAFAQATTEIASSSTNQKSFEWWIDWSVKLRNFPHWDFHNVTPKV